MSNGGIQFICIEANMSTPLDDARSILILSLFCTYIVTSCYSAVGRYDRESHDFSVDKSDEFAVATVIYQIEEVPVKKPVKKP